MIFGDPKEFAIFYDVIDESEDGNWNYGPFLFFIGDEIYPSKGFNYTIFIAINDVVPCIEEILECKSGNLDFSKNDYELMRDLIRSNNFWFYDDPEGMEFDKVDPMGVIINPYETMDTGFHLFYCQINEKEECLVYSDYYGRNAKRKVLKKGTVANVIEEFRVGSLKDRKMI